MGIPPQFVCKNNNHNNNKVEFTDTVINGTYVLIINNYVISGP